jgi:Bacterial Ig-like domain (group 3)
MRREAGRPRVLVALVTLGVAVALGLSGMSAPAQAATPAPAWLHLAVPAAPSWGINIASGYDLDTRQVLLFGGETTPGQLGDFDSNQTWVWSYAASSWVLQHPSTSPPAREGASLAFDAATHQMLLYGGSDDETGLYRHDTWQWDGSTWRRIPTSSSPPDGATIAYDTATKQIIALADGPTGAQTWLWTGTDWTRLAPPTQAPHGRLVFDRTVNRLLDVVWSTGGTLQLWGWNGTTWSLRSTTGLAPAMTPDFTVAYDPALGATVFVGATGSAVNAWALTGSVWSPLPSPATSDRVHALVWDGAHGQLVLFTVAATYAVPQNNTWALRAPTTTTLAAAPEAATAGAGVTLSASVRAPGTGVGTPAASGKVAFAVGGVTVPGCAARPLVKGTATCVTTFTSGAHLVQAQFVASNAYLPSAAALTLTVTP